MTPFRRIAALLAVLALVYATGFAPLAHAAGLPMMMPAGLAMASHEHGQMDHEAVDHASIDHAAMNHDMAGPDQLAPPCDTGCMLCKDCALCLFASLPAVSLPSVALRYTDYRPLVAALRGGIRPDLPVEPPRV